MPKIYRNGELVELFSDTQEDDKIPLECKNCGFLEPSQDTQYEMSQTDTKTCKECGYENAQANYVSNDWWLNMPGDSQEKALYLDRLISKPKKTVYNPLTHLDKILRWIEGSHRGHIPDDLIAYVKKKAIVKYEGDKGGKTCLVTNVKKYRMWFKQFPDGSKHYNSIPFVMNLLKGESFQFHPLLKRDLKMVYQDFVIDYQLSFVKRNGKKLPPVNFLCIRILQFLDTKYNLPYDISDYIYIFNNLKGKSRRVNSEIIQSIFTDMNFDFFKESTGYVEKQFKNK